WFARLQRYHESRITAREAGLPPGEWTEIKDDTDARGRSVRRQVDRFVGTRELSLLQGDAGAKRLDLPQLLGGDPRPFEVVGIPITEPGYHVVEIESARLGEALLERRAPMFVRTGVLVTNLGVHFKHGRENSLVWVTTLDRGAPVAGAEVSVHDCRGQVLWSGSTDASGLARVAQALPSDTRGCVVDEGLFVTARKADAGGVDSAFVFSNWQQGIEGWRFGVPTGSGAEPELRAHTVFDRQLLRAGETVSMKHFVRLETLQGLAMLTPDALPTALKIVHQGSGQEFSQALQWHAGRSAASAWVIPPAARLGLYRVLLERDSADPAQRRQWPSGEFRVEQFRVPLVDARVVPPQAVPVAPQELVFGVQMNHLSGGAMAQAPLSASALLTPRVPRFAGFDGFSFEPPRQGGPDAQAPPLDDSQGASRREGKLVADKLPLLTGADGTARLLLKDLPRITRPSELLAEVSFNDPNGELQTVGTTVPLWPSAVVLGLKTGSWVSRSGQVAFSVLALDTAGRPIKGQAVEVRGRLAQVTSTRKRMVGGFYAYDNRTELKELGALCSGNTDVHGLLRCEAHLASAGEVELVAQAQDAAGHAAQAAASVWVTRQGELWFAQDNDDRIDVLPEKRRYEPGETARLQVRMPFREATALLTVEREGVIETRVLRLRGDDPTVELKIQKEWGPNVYVSVFVVRGRIRDLPWTSFFRWGWKEPLNWARSFWYEGREYQAPTARVDLSKPAFKLGVAALQVGIAAHELQVKVTADKAQYGIRQTALVRIAVTQGGKPAAGAEVAFAAVDEGLLALRDNGSWDLLNAMHRERAWGVQTSTAQGEIIGRRHYGRKAMAPGGGGGRGGTRELFDTLLLWQARQVLDARGEATLEVPLNDSLTSFRLVAVADDGASSFGTGSTLIRVTQDLQLLPGLPPLVREGDSFQALLTLRNTTAREMKLRAALAGTLHNAPGVNLERAPLVLPPQELVLAAGSAREIGWAVQVPAEVSGIAWQAAVDELGSAPAKDRVKIEQRVLPAVPVRVLQSTLQQLDGDFSLAVAAPADALPLQGAKRGGLNVAVQPRLGAALPGLRRFFDAYPFTCLEQLASRAMGLRDAASWAALAEVLPTYLDSDGLAGYFPPRADEAARGSDRLTAYLLAASHEAGFELPRAARDAMLDGLTAFVQGRIERSFWSPESARSMDLDVRKLAAIEALARHGRAQPKMLGSLDLTPNLWPTAALIDWLSILKRLDGVAERGPRLQQAQQMLRARLVFAGTTLRFSTENSDFWWWLMDSPDANAARLILA
ncbi:MAG TPA: MG2 domain-containing protein, partial [Rubrivivax sp.]|nr:MG2 domain-containing protein [Rubrivivax sp.]